MFALTSVLARAQDLAPRAYVITPVGSNAITLSDTYSTGSVFADPSVAIFDVKARFDTSAISYYRAFDMLGRSANVTVLVPYLAGNVRATIVDQDRKAYRSGLADSRIRFAANLRGGPAMTPDVFSSWREKSLIGFSFTAAAPTGQYDSTRLINIGRGRWAFKPEIGLSHRWNGWAIDTYAGVWFFTPNGSWFPGSSYKTQQPVGATEAHLTYYVSRRFWASLDGDFWVGGRSTVNGVRRFDQERDSRAGFTVAIPVSRHDTMKFSYASGAYVTIGGAYTTLSLAWQYAWIGKGK